MTNRMLLAAALFLSSAQAAAPATWRKPDDVPGFGQWRTELQRLQDTYGKLPVAHFCIVVKDVVFRDGNDEKRTHVADVYWREMHSIQGYGASGRNRMTADLSAGLESIDLRRDLVATEAGIGTSTSRVTRAYAMTIIDQCRRHGTSIVLTRSGKDGPR